MLDLIRHPWWWVLSFVFIRNGLVVIYLDFPPFTPPPLFTPAGVCIDLGDS